MKELQIPYIGVKIESLPTILQIVETSRSDEDFVKYYVKIGKSKKTATEYLASLRNLKLAERDSSLNTKLLGPGKMMINEDVQNLYISLLKHCLRKFPDLRIVKDVVSKSNSTSLNNTFDQLISLGFTVRRKQTLSSYIKLIIEGSKNNLTRRNTFNQRFEKEILEYNQFIKIIENYFAVSKSKKTTLAALYAWVSEKTEIERDLFISYLNLLRLTSHFRLVEINARVIPNNDDAFPIGGRLFYYIEKIS